MSAKPPFDPVQFLHLANNLGGFVNDEARLRSAVSRGYYAMYLQARGKLHVRRIGHADLIEKLRGMQNHRTTGDMFDSLLRLRQVADYDIVPPAAYADWKRNWYEAQSLISKITPKLKTI